MAVEGGMKCIKYLIFFFNFVFWLCGVALVILGIVVKISMHKTIEIKDPSASAIPIVLMAAGVLIFFITFFGCCGAWRENYCMIATFSVLLSMIIIVEVAAAVVGYIYREKMGNITAEAVRTMIDNYIKGDTMSHTTLDAMQQKWKCCGVNGTEDWQAYNADGLSVPESCCRIEAADCGQGNAADIALVFQQGCLQFLTEMFEEDFMWVIVAALVIAFLQLIGITFACTLMRGIRKGYEVM